MIPAVDVTRYLGSLLREQLGPTATRFRNVVIDSRQARKGDLFVALPGERTDGQLFAADAAKRGATGLLLREPVDGLPPGVTSFIVADPLLALQRLAAGHRDRSKAKVVGITGSVGKTTTKEIVASVLGVKYRILKSEANYNNEIGLPLTLLKLTKRHQRAVLEMGMYALGEIRTLCEIARPEIGVVTNIGPVHLERLGSMEAIVAAKAELPESLPPHGFAIFNADDPFVRTMAERTRARPLYYGLGANTDVRAANVHSKGLDGVSFDLLYAGRSVRVKTKLPGRHIVSNALAAAAVGLADGLALEEVASGLESADAQVRVRTHRGRNGATLIDDTYNASPASLTAALDLLAEIPGRRIAVLGDMAELGAASREGHLTVGRRAAETADVIHAVGEEAALIAQAARDAGHGNVHHWHSKEAVAEALAGGLRQDDVVLLKASRAMAFETIVEALRE
jgi:UDP-N-acetylmuramoyl-tripeptide--D-alanyl-D-alanine ligase